MLLKTILNDCLRWKSFVYGDIYFQKIESQLMFLLRLVKMAKLFVVFVRSPVQCMTAVNHHGTLNPFLF